MLLYSSAGDIFIEVFTGLSASVVLPIIFFIAGLCIKLKPKDSFIAAMTLGIAFIGMGMVISFMFGYMQTAMGNFATLTGLKLRSVDFGWATMASIAWAFLPGLALFPLLILINIIMLATKTTKTLNVDFWNYWHNFLEAVIVVTILKFAGMNIVAASILAVIAGCASMPFQLITADAAQKQMFQITQIPSVTTTHQMNLFCGILRPFAWVLGKIKFLNKQVDAETLRKKIGIFGDPGFIGLIVGIIIGVVAYWPTKEHPAQIYMALVVGMQTAAALTLLPMVAKLFMQALMPISGAMNNLLTKKYKNKEIYLGLDWPIAAGNQTIWTAIILWVPITLVYSFLISWGLSSANTQLQPALPLASLLNTSFGLPAFLVTGGNLLQMLVLGVIIEPIFLLFASWLGPVITQYVVDNQESLRTILTSEKVDQIVNGDLYISWAGPDDAWWIFSMAYLPLIFIPNGHVDPVFGTQFGWLIGVSTFVVWVALFTLNYKMMIKKGDQIWLDLKKWTQEEYATELLKRRMKYNWMRKVIRRDLVAIDGYTSLRKFNNYQYELKQQQLLADQEAKAENNSKVEAK